jgi:chemotaxis protein MotB
MENNLERFSESNKLNKKEDEGELWILSYGDLVTLLACFFVFLVGFSTLDLRGLSKTLFPIETPPEKIKLALDEFIKARKELIGSTRTEIQKEGVMFEIYNDALLFPAGSAQLKEGAKILLKDLSKLMQSNPFIKGQSVSIEGHTDCVPISGKLAAIYPSNWELSAARAASVARYLIEECNLEDDRFMVLGFSDTKPRLNPDNPNKPISENRRVIFKFKDYKFKAPSWRKLVPKRTYKTIPLETQTMLPTTTSNNKNTAPQTKLLWAAAEKLRQEGKYTEAKVLYLKILQVVPNHSPSIRKLQLIAESTKK